MTTVLANQIIYTMPELRWPAVCGRACFHPMCERWRENAKTRCSKCDRLIAPGERFVELRNPITRSLVEQRHVSCPTVNA